MNADELKRRTQGFALSIIHLLQGISIQHSTIVIGRQLLRCATSVGANYRAACRAKSRADFIAKLKIVEEECDESAYWLELLEAIRPESESKIRPLIYEANQILSIIVASIKTARSAQKIQSSMVGDS